MAELSLQSLERLSKFDTRIDVYIDGDGKKSYMKWIPPFRAARALTVLGATATASNTVGDWFHPADAPSGAVSAVDYATVDMGGYWVDMYLCSSPDASASRLGTAANGTTVHAYVSQPLVSPRVSQNIAHFKTYLATRFATGDFEHGSGGLAGTAWAGKGGLMTDQHWFELWVWSRINGLSLRGNTFGYSAADHVPAWHGDGSEVGMLDVAQLADYGASLTGSGPKQWRTIVDDFCGNRWEFTDGLRLFNGGIYSSGKTIDPPASYADAAYLNTVRAVSGVTAGQMVASYRDDVDIVRHGIPASTTAAGAGPMDGQGFWFSASGEIVALRGGACYNGALCPGALYLSAGPAIANWNIGARAVLVP